MENRDQVARNAAKAPKPPLSLTPQPGTEHVRVAEKKPAPGSAPGVYMVLDAGADALDLDLVLLAFALSAGRPAKLSKEALALVASAPAGKSKEARVWNSSGEYITLNTFVRPTPVGELQSFAALLPAAAPSA